MLTEIKNKAVKNTNKGQFTVRLITAIPFTQDFS
jgi:hypothetical protein